MLGRRMAAVYLRQYHPCRFGEGERMRRRQHGDLNRAKDGCPWDDRNDTRRPDHLLHPLGHARG
jgi:hypothetical protein